MEWLLPQAKIKLLERYKVYPEGASPRVRIISRFTCFNLDSKNTNTMYFLSYADPKFSLTCAHMCYSTRGREKILRKRPEKRLNNSMHMAWKWTSTRGDEQKEQSIHESAKTEPIIQLLVKSQMKMEKWKR